MDQYFIFYILKTSETLSCSKMKHLPVKQYGLRLLCLYKYKPLVDKIKWNNGIGKHRHCKLILWTSDMLLKTFEYNLTPSIRNVIIQRWTNSNRKVNGFFWNTWKYTFDGPDICFLLSLNYSLRIFVEATKSHGGGNSRLAFVFNWTIATLVKTYSLSTNFD